MAATTRISWLVMGTAFGLGCASSLTPFLPSAWFAPVVNVVEQAASKESGQPSRTLEDIVTSAPQTAEIAEPSAESRPLAVEVAVHNGDTLLDLLRSSGISKNDARDIIASVAAVYDPKKLDVGKNVLVQFSKELDEEGNPVVKSISMPVSNTSTVEVERNYKEQFAAKKIDVPTERKLAHAGGVINSSIYQTCVDNGLPAPLLNELISAYSYDVDFQREVKQGDSMDVLFERIQTKEGEQVGHGNIVFAELGLGDRTLKIYRYVDKSGNPDYYNAKGESVRKALLRTPVNGAKITSGFGMRNHPLLGYTRMHRGVDFGAPIGTPIYAAGDGTVEFVGPKAGYGNYVRIKHNGQYSSAYAHISRFASGVAPGRKVKQGQIIAYVGMTGMATGPHLHYEILANNEQVNPANVKFKTGNVLQGKELLAFRKTMAQVEQQLASLKGDSSSVAMADSPKKTIR